VLSIKSLRMISEVVVGIGSGVAGDSVHFLGLTLSMSVGGPDSRTTQKRPEPRGSLSHNSVVLRGGAACIGNTPRYSHLARGRTIFLVMGKRNVLELIRIVAY